MRFYREIKISLWNHIVAIGSMMLLLLSACSDFGERDNPLDPGADNYIAPSSSIEEDESSSSVKEKSSSSVKQSSSSRDKSSSSTKQSSSSVKQNSSSSDEKSHSSSSIEEKGSSSSVESNSSSSMEQSSSSSDELSSSSVILSSDSQEESSSSVSSSSVELPPASSSSAVLWTCGDSTVTQGDREYKTVVIKEQCWTKENLRYVPSTGNTMCYDDEESNCEKYGLLYDYEAASLACPTGWRLPTSAEYEALAEYSMEGATLYGAGAHFKATTGWTPESGDDFLEFTALPGGKCTENKSCLSVGKLGYWWTSTEKVKNTSHLALSLNGDGDSYSAETKMDNDQFISVRCVKR